MIMHCRHLLGILIAYLTYKFTQLTYWVSCFMDGIVQIKMMLSRQMETRFEELGGKERSSVYHKELLTGTLNIPVKFSIS